MKVPSKRLVFAIGGAICLCGWTVYCLRDDSPSAFLAKYPKYVGGGEIVQLRPPSKWIGQKNGLRIHTFRADFAEVVDEARRHLLPANWTESVNPGFVVFTSPLRERVQIMAGRSMYVPDAHYRYKGKPMYGRHVVRPKYATRYDLPATTVEGWVTIDHSWNTTARPLDPWLDKMKTMPGPIASLAHKLTS